MPFPHFAVFRRVSGAAAAAALFSATAALAQPAQLGAAPPAADARLVNIFSAVKTPADCLGAAVQAIAREAAAADTQEREQVARVAGLAAGNCPDTSIGAVAEGLARQYPAAIDDIAVAMTTARPVAVGEIVLGIVGTLPEERRLAAFDRIVKRLRREVPGLANSEAFAAIPGIGALSGPAFTPYVFPLLLEEEDGPLVGPGPGVSPS